MAQHVSEVAETIANIIGSAKDDVVISSGRLDSRCYEKAGIIRAIKKAKANEVSFSVVAGPKLDPATKNFVALLKDNIFISPNTPKFHFTVADGKNFRFETRDIDDHDNSTNMERWNDPVSGNYLRNKLLASLPQTKPYTLVVKARDSKSRRTEKKGANARSLFD